MYVITDYDDRPDISLPLRFRRERSVLSSHWEGTTKPSVNDVQYEFTLVHLLSWRPPG